jgi:ankyrin repeat protein
VLIERGAKLEGRPKKVPTPLFIGKRAFLLFTIFGIEISQVFHRLASQLGHLEVVTYFVDIGANIESRIKTGATPLYIAAFEGNLDVLQYLVNKKANIHMTCLDGSSPLHAASENGHLEVVQYLINLGVEINLPDTHGATAIYRGIKLRLQDVIKIYSTLNFYCLLAAQEGHIDIVELLIQSGGNFNFQCTNGNQPIHIGK